MKTLFCFLNICLILCFQQCVNKPETFILELKPYKSSCIGEGVRCCFIAKRNGDWKPFYSNINGFNYEWGHSYKIEVKSEPVKKQIQDESSMKYRLLKVIKKEKIDQNFEFELILKDKYGIYIQSLNNDIYNFMYEVELKDTTGKIKNSLENESIAVVAICKFKNDVIEVIDIK